MSPLGSFALNCEKMRDKSEGKFQIKNPSCWYSESNLLIEVDFKFIFFFKKRNGSKLVWYLLVIINLDIIFWSCVLSCDLGWLSDSNGTQLGGVS